MPHSIRKLREANYVVPDMYKISKPKIPTNAGIIVLFISYISVSILPVLTRILNLAGILNDNSSDLSETNLAFLLVISIFALYGLVDDLVDIGQKLKLIIPLTFSYPLLSIINPSVFSVPFIKDIDLTIQFYDIITFGDLFSIFIISIYVMVVANLVNMHSGFNGLQSGLSIILLSTIIIKSWQEGILKNILPVGAFLGAMLAFWLFNKYPSKVFEGNIGSLLFGSIIGCILVIQEFWLFGIFILFPHIINFFQWLYWLYLMHFSSDLYLNIDGDYTKFGYLNDEGKLQVPNSLTLKWIPCKWYNYSEKESTILMYCITLIFCVFGLIFF